MPRSWGNEPVKPRHQPKHRQVRTGLPGSHRKPRRGGCWRHAVVGLVWVASVAILTVYC